MSEAAGVVVLIGRIAFAFFFGAVAAVGHFKRDQAAGIWPISDP